MPGDKFRMRKAQAGDVEKIFALSMDPETRHNSGNPAPIEWNGHVTWFERILRDPKVLFFVFERESDNRFMGQARMAEDNGVWTVSISLARNFRGKNLGGQMLRAAMTQCPGGIFRADILAENAASINMFSKLGFHKTGLEIKNGRLFGIWQYEK